jgi:hypothetical protein
MLGCSGYRRGGGVEIPIRVLGAEFLGGVLNDHTDERVVLSGLFAEVLVEARFLELATQAMALRSGLVC